MEKWFEKNINKIIAIFILLQPILDILTGVCVNTLHWKITLGIIIRVIFLIFICLVVLFVFKKKKILIPYLIIGVYFILYTIGMVVYKDSSLLPEIQNLVRTFYFPILFISLYAIKDKIRISNMTFLTMILLYIVAIFIPTIIGIGYKSYQITKAGTLGFFNSANEISGIISILTPILFVVFYKSQKPLPILIFCIMYLVVILMVGTKTPLLTLIITLGTSIIYLWSYFIKKKQYQYIILSILVLIAGCVSLAIVIPKTNFYKNIKVHLEYLGLEHVTEVFKDEELVDHFIFSSRLKFMDKKSKLYNKASLYEKFFGIGYVNNKKTTKLIEMDYFDIFYSHGIVGFIVFFSIMITMLFLIISNRKKGGYENGMKVLSTFLILFLAFFTGHIITAPSVSLIVILLLLSLEKREKKDLLFTSYNMDLGGIEKALLNLVNRIDLNKYNVEIVLEEKKGIFLDKFKDGIIVREVKVSNYRDALIRKAINVSRKLWFKILNGNNYDFSCCYTTYSYSGSKLALMASTNTAFYVHSDYDVIYPVDSDFYEFFESRNIRDYKRIIFVSNESEEEFIKRYKDLKDRCFVFNNFIDTEEIRERSKEKIQVKKNPKQTIFAYVGRLDDSSKKILRQIHLVKEIPSIDLWIVGDGQDREMYEEEVRKLKLEDRVTFFGKKENPFPYMKEADYIILTSDYEGFSVTLLEAVALKKNIITTVAKSDDIIDMKKLGYLVSMDEKEMAKEVKEILKGKTKKQEIDFDALQEKRMKRMMDVFNG